jgi:hypothetical protein
MCHGPFMGAAMQASLEHVLSLCWFLFCSNVFYFVWLGSRAAADRVMLHQGSEPRRDGECVTSLS